MDDVHSGKPLELDARDPYYAAVAQQLLAQIASGGLRPGDRLPSVRELARQTGRSITTVLRAYEHLEALGAIASRPRSGYFVSAGRFAQSLPQTLAAPAGGAPSLISGDLVSAFLEARSAGPLTFGDSVPVPALLPVASLNRVARQLLRDEPDLAMPYMMSPGLQRLRQQLAGRLAGHGAAVAADDIVITSGGMEAINLCLRALTRAGDTLLMEAPTFYGLLQAAEEHGLRIVELPNDPLRGIDPDDVRRAVSRHRIAAALLVQNFNNPTGSLLPEDAKREVVRTLNGAGIPLIEDDVYGELGFVNGRPTPLKAYDEADLVLYCGSFSKTLSPGLRVGWIASHRHARELTRRKFTLSCATASLPQLIASRYLESGGYERHLRGLRANLARSIARISEAVLKDFPAGTSVSRPQGGFVLWIELPKAVDSVEMFRHAAQAGIAIRPGTLFSASAQYAHHIRLNCAMPWSDTVAQGVATLGRIACGLAGQRGS
ncbi:MAG: PLP-dependent aminotransferase family protein [Solimonas sp.]